MFTKTQKVVLKLEVPGIEEKDLDVRVENHTLTVKGEREFEKEEKEENFHRIERRYGSFYRAFTLPSTVDTENVGGDLQCGRAQAGTGGRRPSQPKQTRSKWRREYRRGRKNNCQGSEISGSVRGAVAAEAPLPEGIDAQTTTRAMPYGEPNDPSCRVNNTGSYFKGLVWSIPIRALDRRRL